MRYKLSRLVPQFALSKQKPQALRTIVKKSRTNRPILVDSDALVRRARFFQAVGHEVRLMILGLLEVEELCLCDIVQALQVPASTIVHHVSMLEDAGAITRKENGKYTSFTVNQDLITKHRVL
jgi:ArsR family transcriptional regulator, lead/cadmium/zinc/bismuth-responsive transcriptional repressor